MSSVSGSRTVVVFLALIWAPFALLAQFLMVDTRAVALRPFCFCNLGFGAGDCYPTEGHILRPLGSLLLLDPEEPSCLLLDGEAATFSRLGTAVPQLASGEPASVRGGASSSCSWYLKQFPYSLPSVPCPPLQFRFVATSIPTLLFSLISMSFSYFEF